MLKAKRKKKKKTNKQTNKQTTLKHKWEESG